MNIEQIEREAAQIAARSGGTETKEMAFARLLEQNPDVYAAYRGQHNAKPLLAQLKAAGVKVQGA